MFIYLHLCILLFLCVVASSVDCKCLIFFQFREELCEDVITKLARMMREECLIAPKGEKEKSVKGKLILTGNKAIINEMAD